MNRHHRGEVKWPGDGVGVRGWKDGTIVAESEVAPGDGVGVGGSPAPLSFLLLLSSTREPVHRLSIIQFWPLSLPRYATPSERDSYSSRVSLFESVYSVAWQRESGQNWTKAGHNLAPLVHHDGHLRFVCFQKLP